MNIRITPSLLHGRVEIPASKSCAHRAIICAALADGTSVLTGVTMSKDIEATIGSMSALGAKFDISSDTVRVSGISSPEKSAVIDCNESGSTLRFIMPVAAALGAESEFLGRGRLPQRPIDIYKRELSAKGVSFITEEMPYKLAGRLKAGRFEVEGSVSSQFITGLMFALPLLDGDSEIIFTSHLESRPYVDITIDILRRFGIEVGETENGFTVRGGQKYHPHDERIEGDYSQAAFFYVADALGSDVEIGNLSPESVQGDRRITEIVAQMSAGGTLGHFSADCSDIPDLVPILGVLGTFGDGDSVIYHAERLKIKESDRLASTAALLGSLGASADITDDGLVIHPVKRLTGGTVDSFGDHRIVMAAAVAATRAEGEVVITGAEAAEKSYPDFFKDYTMLGGKTNVIDLE